MPECAAVYRFNLLRIFSLVALVICPWASHAQDAAPESGDKVQSVTPAPAPDRGIAEYNRGRALFADTADAAADETEGGQRTLGPGTFALQAVLAVAVLAFLFWAALQGMRKYLPGGKQLFASPSMEVLGRTHLDPRRYISLVRVGRRILVVAVSADGITSLSEITDGAEVAELLEDARPKTESGVNMFQRLFTTHVTKVEEDQDLAEVECAAEDLETTLHGLRRRVNALRGWE